MQQTSKKEPWLGSKGDPLVIVQEIIIWSYKQIVYVKTKIHPRKWGA